VLDDQNYQNKKTSISHLVYCVVPENIHTPTTEGYWKFQEGGVLKAKIFKGKKV